jgi:hypothetical protein
MPAPHIQPALVVIGFGVCLFVALVCLLKWQFRKHIYGKVRMRRGLRVYAENQKGEPEYSDAGETERLEANS